MGVLTVGFLAKDIRRILGSKYLSLAKRVPDYPLST